MPLSSAQNIGQRKWLLNTIAPLLRPGQLHQQLPTQEQGSALRDARPQPPFDSLDPPAE